MTVQVLIPTPLQKFTADQATVSLDATSVDELIKALDGTFPAWAIAFVMRTASCAASSTSTSIAKTSAFSTTKPPHSLMVMRSASFQPWLVADQPATTACCV